MTREILEQIIFIIEYLQQPVVYSDENECIFIIYCIHIVRVAVC